MIWGFSINGVEILKSCKGDISCQTLVLYLKSLSKVLSSKLENLMTLIIHINSPYNFSIPNCPQNGDRVQFLFQSPEQCIIKQLKHTKLYSIYFLRTEVMSELSNYHREYSPDDSYSLFCYLLFVVGHSFIQTKWDCWMVWRHSSSRGLFIAWDWWKFWCTYSIQSIRLVNNGMSKETQRK